MIKGIRICKGWGGGLRHVGCIFMIALLMGVMVLEMGQLLKKRQDTDDVYSKTDGTGSLMFTSHFGGEFGKHAFKTLLEWTDDLFAETMTRYRLSAQGVCTDIGHTRAQCNESVIARRPPEPKGFNRYDMFNPYLTCPGGKRSMTRLGSAGDGGKWICGELLEEGCVVFSLGSNGQYDFEEAILKQTKCKVFTFDCTYDGKDLDPKRHKYLKKCIGSRVKSSSSSQFTTLAQAMSELKVSKISLLKIDIEGYEYDEMSAWRAEDLFLPEQVSIEVHHSQVIYAGSSQNQYQDFSNLLWPVQDLILSDLSLFFGHLARLGYAIVSREDNPFGNCCSEFLLLKVADWK